MKTICRKIDFVGNCIAESSRCFFVKVLNFTNSLIIEIQIFEKRPKKFCSRRPICKFFTHGRGLSIFTGRCFRMGIFRGSEICIPGKGDGNFSFWAI